MKTWDKPRFSPYFTVEARQSRVCPWDKPGVVPGTSPGPKGSTESLCEKVYVPSSLATIREEKQHKHKLFGPDFLRTFLTLTPGRPWVKKFLPITAAAETRTFWCGRPRFLARTSMTRRVFEKLCTKKFALIFWPLEKKRTRSRAAKRRAHGPHMLQSCSVVRGLLGTGPPDPTLKSASPSPPQGSIWHRFNIDSTFIRHRNRVKSGNRCQINIKSM